MSDKPLISERRGYEADEMFGSVGVVFVRADMDTVSKALNEMLGGTLQKDICGKRIDEENMNTIIFQFKGHEWTIFYYDICEEDFIKKFSKTYDLECIYFEYEDTAVWTGYKLIQKGEVREDYQFGPDYTEDIEEYLDEIGEEIPQPDPAINWDIDVANDEEEFRFKSSLRSVEIEDVQDSKKFMNAFFTAQNAWFPDWDYLPDETDACKSHKLKRTDFVRVDLLTR